MMQASEISTPTFDAVYNDGWLILECDLSEKCKNPQTQMKQELKKIGISII